MKPIKRAIVICWIMLLACFVMKIFGGNWFEIVCTNEHFIKACKIIDENRLLQSIVGICVYIPSVYFVFVTMSMVETINKKQKIYIVVCLLFVCAFSEINITLKSILEFVAFLLSPLIINKLNPKEKQKPLIKTWYLGILGYCMILLFQVVSMFTRNIGIAITHDSFLTTFILMIDYYIMILLYYLYFKNKSKKEC